jgi:hypothetical protein
MSGENTKAEVVGEGEASGGLRVSVAEGPAPVTMTSVSTEEANKFHKMIEPIGDIRVLDVLTPKAESPSYALYCGQAGEGLGVVVIQLLPAAKELPSYRRIGEPDFVGLFMKGTLGQNGKVEYGEKNIVLQPLCSSDFVKVAGQDVKNLQNQGFVDMARQKAEEHAKAYFLGKPDDPWKRPVAGPESGYDGGGEGLLREDDPSAHGTDTEQAKADSTGSDAPSDE